MIIASSRLLQACLLSYSIHHKWSWNFTVKFYGLSRLPAAWCNMSWTWNLITVVISQTKNNLRQVLLSFKGALYSKHKKLG